MRMESGEVASPPSIMKSPNMSETDPNSVIKGHRACQTKNAIWLCLEDIYGKLHRPNIYDIGGSYIDNVPDYWFTCKTEKIHNIFLLHLFAGNHVEGTHSLGVSSGALVFSDKDQIIRLTQDIVTFKFDCKQHNQSYITTYDFNSADVEHIIKGKKLYIAVQLTDIEKNPVNSVKEGSEAIKMLHDNVALLTEPVGSDFIIESEDGVEFPVHRNVLCLHSEVFKAMLKEDMAESQNGRVKLIDVSAEDLKIMLEYIYTSTIKVIEDINFANIIMLADRFNLLGLRTLCDHILIDQLAGDTALDILVVADRFDCSQVKCKALQYIKHNLDQFKDSKFEQIDNMALMREVFAVFLS